MLKNVSSPPTIALLSEHAKPLEISEAQVIIVCQKEFSLKALSSEQKKKAVADAAEKLFGKTGIKVVVRLASPADKLPEVTLEKKNSIIDSRPVEKNEESDEAEYEESLVQAVPVLTEDSVKVDSLPPSDQVSMVMNLFNGKYIE